MIRILKSSLLFFVIFLVLAGAAVLLVSERAEDSRGRNAAHQRFEVRRGEGLTALAARLAEAGLIENRTVFLVYVLKTGQYRLLQAGEYWLSGSTPLPELVAAIRSGKVIPPGTRITFPEGWTIADMAERLTANDLPGADFKTIALNPYPKWRERFSFLRALPTGQSLEGYLFPDTYIFPEQATGELIVDELLETFGKKVTPDMLAATEKRGMTLYDLLTLASIVEMEVRTEGDRRLVADLFLRRLKIGQALQSDATLRYVLGEKKIKYSLEETRVASPYNTYQNVGLPPGPIGNPSLQSIWAVIDPLPNDYYYFLNNPETGQTVFAKTFEEHVINKANNQL